MEIIERLFENENFDHKNILNRSNKIIPVEVLDQIENQGVTTEHLETLGVPVFKYKTQITIHGLFPELKVNWINGYKNLFQNKNLSIGVKYNAIDALKKKMIYTTCQKHSDWFVHKSCTEYEIHKSSEYFSSKEQYLELLPKMKSFVDHINKDLFIGSSGICLYQAFGTFVLVAFIRVDAIKQENVIPLIENILNDSFDNITDVIVKKENEKRLEHQAWEAKILKERQEKIEREKPLIEEFKKVVSEAGYEYKKDLPIYSGLQLVLRNNRDENKLAYNIRIYGKENSRQKHWRWIEFTDVSKEKLNVAIPFESSHLYMTECTKSTVSSWVLQPKVEVKNEVETKTEVKIESSDIKIAPYKNAIVVTGLGTKLIKDELKALGGSFNFHLPCGPGWIFPPFKRASIEKLINK